MNIHIFDFEPELLHQILRHLTWKKILYFLSTSKIFSKVHNSIIHTLKNDSLFRDNAKTVIIGCIAPIDKTSSKIIICNGEIKKINSQFKDSWYFEIGIPIPVDNTIWINSAKFSNIIKQNKIKNIKNPDLGESHILDNCQIITSNSYFNDFKINEKIVWSIWIGHFIILTSPISFPTHNIPKLDELLKIR